MNFTKLNQLKDENLLTCQKHPTLDLLVWNYSKIAQYNNAFVTHPELLSCRGLITDTAGNIIARGFNKFFNYEELSEWPTGKETFIYKKMDGSLLIIFKYRGVVCSATRGSFTSTQAIAGLNYFKKTYGENIEEGKSYLFEYTSPNNLIVVRYDKEEIFQLGILDRDGMDLPMESRFLSTELKATGVFSCDLYDQLKESEVSNEEGFVLVVPMAGQQSWRCKIKYAEYVRLHKLVSNLSTKSIWEILSTNGNFNLLVDSLPDEHYQWLKKEKEKLESQFSEIKSNILKVITTIPVSDKKETALWILENHKDISHHLFAHLNGRSFDHMIWKSLQPKFEIPSIDI